MLNAIKKKFFNVASATSQEVTMVEPQTEQPQAAVPNTAELSALVAQMASQSDALLAVQTQFAELTSKYEGAVAALAEIEQAKADLIAEAKTKQLAARKVKVEATIGTAKSDAILAATESMDDAAFETIVSAFAVSLATESQSAMFTEAGVSAEADLEVDPVKKLAENLAAKFNPK